MKYIHLCINLHQDIALRAQCGYVPILFIDRKAYMQRCIYQAETLYQRLKSIHA